MEVHPSEFLAEEMTVLVTYSQQKILLSEPPVKQKWATGEAAAPEMGPAWNFQSFSACREERIKAKQSYELVELGGWDVKAALTSRVEPVSPSAVRQLIVCYRLPHLIYSVTGLPEHGTVPILDEELVVLPWALNKVFDC